MEIDLDNLVFNGLDEAEERNAERLDDADKKAQQSTGHAGAFFMNYCPAPLMAAWAQASSR